MTWDEETERFLRHLQAEGRSPGHAANARGVLLRFGDRTGGKGYEELSKDDVEAWLADLRGQGLSASTVKGYFSIVKATLRYLNDGETPACLKGMKATAKESRVKTKGELLTEEEFQRLLKVMRPGKALIFRLLWDSGARPSEVLGLRREDLSFERVQGREVVELSFSDTKNGEPRAVPVVNPETIEALKDHLGTIENGYLFPSPLKAGAPLRRSGVWHYLSRAAKQAGIKKRVYPYLFRHTAATRRFNAPAGVRDRMMGWKSDMAKNYEHLATEDVRDYLLETEGPATGGMTDEEAVELMGKLLVKVSQNPALAERIQEALRERSRSQFPQ